MRKYLIVFICLVAAFNVSICWANSQENVVTVDEYLSYKAGFNRAVKKWDDVIYYDLVNMPEENKKVFSRYAAYFSRLTGLKIEEWDRGKSNRPNLAIFYGSIEYIMTHKNYQKIFYDDSYKSYDEYLNWVKKASGSFYFQTSKTAKNGFYYLMYAIWNPLVSTWDLERQVKLIYYQVLTSAVGPIRKCGSVLSFRCGYDYRYLSDIDEAFLESIYSNDMQPGTNMNVALPKLRNMMLRKLNN